jgi:hypothetical protein
MIFFLNSSLVLVNAYEIFFSITFFDLKKGPTIEKKLLAKILDNLKPIILKIVKIKIINKN